mgnify:CR=1 FL=1
MTITIKDVARKAGVSPSTVSRVINGKGVISEETKIKINKVMEELHYHPNSLARNFANGSSYAMGLVIDAKDENTFSNAFFNRSVFAIETVAQNNGYNLLIVNDRDGIDSISSIEKLVFERKVDGLILPPSTIKPKLIKKFLELEFPFVVLGEPKLFKTESSWVDVNNKQGSENAIEHLVSKGYKRIAYVYDEKNNLFEQNRLEGYKNGLKKAGLKINDEYIIETPRDKEKYYEETVKILSGSNPPDAFLCSNNDIAFHVLKAIKAKQFIVPDQIGMITFDNYPIAEYMDPPLSVIDVDTYALGEQVANILLQKIERNNSSNQHTLISTKLILRESTND